MGCAIRVINYKFYLSPGYGLTPMKREMSPACRRQNEDATKEESRRSQVRAGPHQGPARGTSSHPEEDVYKMDQLVFVKGKPMRSN